MPQARCDGRWSRQHADRAGGAKLKMEVGFIFNEVSGWWSRS